MAIKTCHPYKDFNNNRYYLFSSKYLVQTERILPTFKNTKCNHKAFMERNFSYKRHFYFLISMKR